MNMFALACFAAVAGALAGCTIYNPPEVVPTAQSVTAAAPSPDCREYAQSVTIGGQPKTVTGTACPQPDGTWRVE